MQGNIDREELAWAAGIFDGEGCVSTSSYMSKSKMYNKVEIYLVNTNYDLLYRFYVAVLEVGQIRTRKLSHIGTKPVWDWRVHSYADVQAVTALLWFKLSSEKKEKLYLALKDSYISKGKSNGS